MALLAWKDLVPSLPQEKSFSSSGEVKANEILCFKVPGRWKDDAAAHACSAFTRAQAGDTAERKPCEDVPPPRCDEACITLRLGCSLMLRSWKT